MKGKNYTQDYSTQQGSHSDLKDKLQPLQTRTAKRIQHHQTSFTTNAKGTSLGRKHKRRKTPTKANPKQLRNGNRNIHIDNYLKCKWIKRSNQKTLTG